MSVKLMRDSSVLPPDRLPPEDLGGGAALIDSEAAPPVPLPAGDLWVFGYGSLMWRPDFPFLECRVARLFGYHRALCVWSWHHRGSPESPGLVLGLDSGGSCVGHAYRVAARHRAEVWCYLRDREMVTPVYVPHGVDVHHDGGRQRALTFLVDRDHPQYAGKLEATAAARVVRHSRGNSGANPDYVSDAVRHLDELGIHDPRLRRIHAIVSGGEETEQSGQLHLE